MEMAASPVAEKRKGPIIDPALCRCCRSIKKCRLLSAEYLWMGQKETYCDMFMDCFGLLLSHLDGDNKDSCICATCVVRLRDACAFRRQVLQCEETFLNSRLQPADDVDKKWDIEVKLEPHDEDTLHNIEGSKQDTHMATVGHGPADHGGHDPADHGGHERDYGGDTYSPRDSDDETLDTILKSKKLKKSDKKCGDRKRKLKKTSMKRQLLSSMKKVREKLDSMIDQQAPDVKPDEKPKPLQKKKKEPTLKQLDHDDMVYQNTVIIVQNSYICPFVNRISMYYCYYCKDQFTDPAQLREHTLTHDPKLFEDMIEYNKMPKMDITRIDCRLCNEKINDLNTFKNHITTVHSKKMHSISNEFLKFRLTMNNLKCTECSSSFPYIDLLVKHMIDHFGTFVCDMCGACFIELASLRSHIKNHNKVDTNFPCEICGKNLKSKYSRFLHVATVHEKKATINCYKCEATFMSYALRTKHLIEVHGDKRTFPCKFCDKVYNRRKTLGEHHRRNHLKVFRHKCDLCDQKFYLPSRLKEHMATHTGERNYRCELCEKSYPRLQSLQEHMRSHGNERRFKCHMCGTAFTQNGSLKTHMKSHHNYDLEGGYT